MVDENTIKRLVSFVQNLEVKLSSVKSIYENLQDLITIVSNTHETIFDELTNIKLLLNDISNDKQKTNQWDNQDENINRKISPLIEQNNDFILNSSPSTTTIIENHRNMKKSNPSSRLKSSKTVSFSLDKNLLNQRLAKETKSETFDEITPPNFPSSTEISPINGKILTNIRIHEIEPKNGDYLRLLNLSNSDDYDLSGHFIQQNTPSKPLCRFRFPSNTIIQAGQTITIWCGNTKDITPQPPYVFVWKEQRKWETASEYLTILAKPNGQSIAWFRNTSPANTDQSSSDILLVHSKANLGLSDVFNSSSSSFKSPSRLSARQNRLSAFHSFANHKPPFAHSPNSPIHPDHHGSSLNTSIDLRSQLNQRVGLSQFLTRAKSSSFAGYTSSKQDLSHMNILRTEPKQEQKQTTLKT